MRHEVRGHPLAVFSAYVSLRRPHDRNTWNTLHSHRSILSFQSSLSLSCATKNEAKLAVIKRLISFLEYVLTLKNCGDGFNIAIVREEQKSAWASPPSDFTPFLGNIQGRSQDFSKGGSQRLLTRSPSGDRRLYMVYTAAFPRVSAGSVVLSRYEGPY